MQDADLALPSSVLPRIGSLATMPSRLASLLQVLPAIVDQVDRLYIYLDQYDDVPAELEDQPRIACILPGAQQRNLGSAGKLLAPRLYGKPCLCFCFDDDILYPPGYVSHLAAALQRHHYRAVVGLHAAVYKMPMTSYVKDRHLVHFTKGTDLDFIVDELGTGTIAFHASVMQLEPENWETPNMTDLLFMLDAIRQRTPRICIRRPELMLKPLAETQADSLYRQSMLDDSAQTLLLQQAMEHYPSAWCLSS